MDNVNNHWYSDKDEKDIIECGTYKFKWNDRMKEMDDSTHLLKNEETLSELRRKLSNDGYILLRNQLPTNLIDDALGIVADNLDSTWNCIDTVIDDKKQEIGDNLYIKNDSAGILLTGYKPITHNKKVLSLLHCDCIINIMYKIFNNQEPITYDTKWVRVKGKNENTEQHSDYYRFNDNCFKMLTVWMPLMDINIERGPLAVCPKSHLLNYNINDNVNGYGMEEEKSDIELPEEFIEFNKTAIWKTTNFKKGDLLIFDIKLVHASLINKTNKFRISIDTRWQPKNVIKFWNDSFIRFKQFIEKKTNQKKNRNQKEIIITTTDQDLNDIMMDCTFTDSDNDIVDTLDFETISKRLCQKTSQYYHDRDNHNNNNDHNNNNNNYKNDSRSTFV